MMLRRVISSVCVVGLLSACSASPTAHLTAGLQPELESEKSILDPVLSTSFCVSQKSALKKMYREWYDCKSQTVWSVEKNDCSLLKGAWYDASQTYRSCRDAYKGEHAFINPFHIFRRTE